MFKTIITFIFVFGLIVIAHEFGHFYFAKKSGIFVREFAIGMGPKILSFHKNGTTYTWRLLPIGGYVRLADESEEDPLQKGMQIVVELDDSDKIIRINTSKKQLFNGLPLEITDYDLQDKLFIMGNVMGSDEVKTYQVDHDAMLIEEDGTEIQIAPQDVRFQSAKLSRRMLTNFAGPLNNFLLAIILFIIVAFLQGGVANTNLAELGQVAKNSPASEAGLKSGMVVKKVNGTKVSNWNEMAIEIGKSSNEVKLEVLDDNKLEKITIKPKFEEVDGKKQAIIGITPQVNNSLWAKIKYGFTETITSSVMIFKALGNLITGFSLNKLGGPVAIFKMSEMAAKSGWITVLYFTASLSVNLGIINLLPIPALDGGKLVLNIYEGLVGRPLDKNKENIITILGFVFVFGLMLLVTWNDLRRFFF